MVNEIKRIEYDGKQYPLVFNINVIEQCQEKYGSITNMIAQLEDMEKWAKPLKFVTREMINEAIDIQNESGREEHLDFVTNKQIGRIITENYQKDSIIKIRELTNEIVRTLISDEAIERSNQKKE